MSKKLTVVLGAGASVSLNKFSSNKGDYNDNLAFKPPTTAGIFNSKGIPRNILTQYPNAQILASDIVRILESGQEPGLEQLLREYLEQVAKNNKSPFRKPLLEVPLYINHLLGEVSNNFTIQPDEYNTLVLRTLNAASEVLFLTTNYDTLLEIPLGQLNNVDFSSKNHYIQENWSLVKIHGSTNWYRRIQNEFLLNLGDKEYYEHLFKYSFPLPLEKDTIIYDRQRFNVKFDGSNMLYPAITIPVDGKYEINCPDEHKQKAEEFISECTNYLVIGTSGRDRDLLELLANNIKEEPRFMFVGRDDNNIALTRDNFVKNIKHLTEYNTAVYAEQSGFTGFIYHKGLDEYLNKLK